jgi:hypothetical protein
VNTVGFKEQELYLVSRLQNIDRHALLFNPEAIISCSHMKSVMLRQLVDHVGHGNIRGGPGMQTVQQWTFSSPFYIAFKSTCDGVQN